MSARAFSTLVDGEHISDVELRFYGEGSQWLIACSHKGARFHFWWKDLDQRVPEVLFKNPPVEAPHRGPGYFPTRKQRPRESKAALALVNAMWSLIGPAEFSAARALWEAKQAKEAEEQRAAILANKVHDAAPELLAVLRECVPFVLAHGRHGAPELAARVNALLEGLRP